MAKQASLDFLSRKDIPFLTITVVVKKNDNNGSHPKEVKTKTVYTNFTQKYDSSYIGFDFVSVIDGDVLKPQCIICGAVLANEAMKQSKFKWHLYLKHKEVTTKRIL